MPRLSTDRLSHIAVFAKGLYGLLHQNVPTWNVPMIHLPLYHKLNFLFCWHVPILVQNREYPACLYFLPARKHQMCLVNFGPA